MQRHLALASFALLSASLLGCGEGQVCPTISIPSVQVMVTTSDGMSPELTLSYTVDGGPAQDCEGTGGDGYICAWDQTGEFVITAEAPGYESASTTVNVEMEDECSVATQMVDLVLMPAP